MNSNALLLLRYFFSPGLDIWLSIKKNKKTCYIFGNRTSLITQKNEINKPQEYGANIMTKQFEFELCKFELLTSVI